MHVRGPWAIASTARRAAARASRADESVTVGSDAPHGAPSAVAPHRAGEQIIASMASDAPAMTDGAAYRTAPACCRSFTP